MNDVLETRRRRALYRACHRGTKEMDWLIGRFAEAHLPAMSEPELVRFERLLAAPDPELHCWILDPAMLPEDEHRPLIEAMRAFHGLE